jgi:hypothetical protein
VSESRKKLRRWAMRPWRKPRAIVDAMRAEGARRLVVVSMMGLGEAGRCGALRRPDFAQDRGIDEVLPKSEPMRAAHTVS